MKNWEYSKLEFNKILEKISLYFLSQSGQEKICELLPFTDKSEIIKEYALID